MQTTNVATHLKLVKLLDNLSALVNPISRTPARIKYTQFILNICLHKTTAAKISKNYPMLNSENCRFLVKI